MRYFSLRQKFRIARIAFQEFFYIPELRLRIPDFRIHPLKVILQLCVIASDFNYNAAAWVTEFSKRLSFNLTNTLTRYVKFTTYFLERSCPSIVKTKTES